MFKKFFVYVDDGDNVMKIVVPAKNEKDAVKFVEGTGEVVRVKEVTEDYPISTWKVVAALNEYGFGKAEQEFIYRALNRCGICDID